MQLGSKLSFDGLLPSRLSITWSAKPTTSTAANAATPADPPLRRAIPPITTAVSTDSSRSSPCATWPIHDGGVRDSIEVHVRSQSGPVVPCTSAQYRYTSGG